MNWDGAACAGRGELFFGPDDEPAGRRNWREGRALAICGRCPLQLACLEHALSRPEKHGIWGGATEAARAHMRRRRAVNAYRAREAAA